MTCSRSDSSTLTTASVRPRASARGVGSGLGRAKPRQQPVRADVVASTRPPAAIGVHGGWIRRSADRCRPLKHRLVVVVASQPAKDYATDSNAVFALVSDVILTTFH